MMLNAVEVNISVVFAILFAVLAVCAIILLISDLVLHVKRKHLESDTPELSAAVTMDSQDVIFRIVDGRVEAYETDVLGITFDSENTVRQIIEIEAPDEEEEEIVEEIEEEVEEEVEEEPLVEEVTEEEVVLQPAREETAAANDVVNETVREQSYVRHTVYQEPEEEEEELEEIVLPQVSIPEMVPLSDEEQRGVLLAPREKLSFMEKYNKLDKSYRKLLDQFTQYVEKKVNCSTQLQTNCRVYKYKRGKLGRAVIRRDVVYLNFVLQNAEMSRGMREEKMQGVKVKPVEVRLTNNEELDSAKQTADITINYLIAEEEYKKEKRREARREAQQRRREEAARQAEKQPQKPTTQKKTKAKPEETKPVAAKPSTNTIKVVNTTKTKKPSGGTVVVREEQYTKEVRRETRKRNNQDDEK